MWLKSEGKVMVVNHEMQSQPCLTIHHNNDETLERSSGWKLLESVQTITLLLWTSGPWSWDQNCHQMWLKSQGVVIIGNMFSVGEKNQHSALLFWSEQWPITFSLKNKFVFWSLILILNLNSSLVLLVVFFTRAVNYLCATVIFLWEQWNFCV